MRLFNDSSQPQLRLLVSAILFLSLIACGAPVGNLDRASASFQNAKNLSQKVLSLCQILQGRSTAPNLENIGLNSEVCNNAGTQAINLGSLKDAKELGFSLVRSSEDIRGEDRQRMAPLNLQTRTELWLNRSLLDLVRILQPLMQQTKTNPVDANKNEMDSEFSIEILEKATFKSENFEFRLKLKLTSTREQNGFLDIENEFLIVSQLFDKKYGAVSIESVSDVPYEKSLLRNAKILIIFVPHAGDVYLDIITELNLHSFGLNSIVEPRILGTLSQGLAKIPEALNKAEEDLK